MVRENMSFPRGRKRKKERTMLRKLTIGAVAVVGLMTVAAAETRADTFTVWAYSRDYSGSGFFAINSPTTAADCFYTIETVLAYLRAYDLDVFYFYIAESDGVNPYKHFWQVYAPGGWCVIQYR
jgi:hypothetical protein